MWEDAGPRNASGNSSGRKAASIGKKAVSSADMVALAWDRTRARRALVWVIEGLVDLALVLMIMSKSRITSIAGVLVVGIVVI